MRLQPAALLLTLPYLAGCAPFLQAMGSGGSAVQVAVQVDRLKLLADGMSYATSRKTLTDHALSKMTDQDCRLWNIASGAQACKAKPAVAALPAIVTAQTVEEAQATTAASSGPLPTQSASVPMTKSGVRDATPVRVSLDAAAQALPVVGVTLPVKSALPPGDAPRRNPAVMRTSIYTELHLH